MPTVSVIIPTYNRAESVFAAVASVLDQTFRDFEVIVVDDGSTDGTAEQLEKSFGEKIRVIRRQNGGVSTARNAGAAVAGGGYLAFLDSDDLWHPEKLEVQVDFHQKNPGFLISQTEEHWIRRGRRVNPRDRHKKPAGYIFPQSLQLCTVSPSSVLLDKRLFEQAGGFDERLRACEDYDLWLRLTPEYPVALVERKLLTKHGGHPDQLSQRYPAMDRFRLYSLGKLLLSGQLNEIQAELVRTAIGVKLQVLILGARKRGRRTNELEALIEMLLGYRIDRGGFIIQATQQLLDDRLYGLH